MTLYKYRDKNWCILLAPLSFPQRKQQFPHRILSLNHSNDGISQTLQQDQQISMAEQTSERPVWPAQCTRYGVQLSCGHCTTIWIDHKKTCFDARADAKKVSKATGQPSTWEKCTPVPKRETQSCTARTGKVKLEDGTFSNQCSMCRPQGSPEEEAREVETQSG
jgi:hypothetical protein